MGGALGAPLPPLPPSPSLPPGCEVGGGGGGGGGVPWEPPPPRCTCTCVHVVLVQTSEMHNKSNSLSKDRQRFCAWHGDGILLPTELQCQGSFRVGKGSAGQGRAGGPLKACCLCVAFSQFCRQQQRGVRCHLINFPGGPCLYSFIEAL